MKKQPNIMFIMSDDHSSNAIRCYGSLLKDVLKTPNMDRLYEEGMKLENFYSTNAICTPARATIMTGQYGHMNGVRTLDEPWVPSDDTNLAKLLQSAGYQTALFGKWHLHCEPEGFDDYKYLYRKPNGKDSFEHNEQGTYYDPSFNEKENGLTQHEGYVTDIITKMTLDYMKNMDEEKPFFIMCHHKAPHDFWEYAERHEHLMDGVNIPVPDSLFEDRSHRCEGSRNYGSSVTPRSSVRSLYEDFTKEDYVTGQLKDTENLSFIQKGHAAYQKYLKDYLRTVAAIDESVGEVLNHLEASGELDNTIVIYTSDQGMFLGEHDYQDKRWCYEESLRAPFLIRYPEGIKGGQSTDSLMANVDVAPTLLDLVGLNVPKAMQGVSQKGMFFGTSSEVLRDNVYFRYWMHRAHRHDNPAHYGIRDGQYKLIFFYGLPLDSAGAIDVPTPAGWELYDMKKDPYELNNVYEDPGYRDVVTELKIKLNEQKEFLEDQDERYPELMAIRAAVE